MKSNNRMGLIALSVLLVLILVLMVPFSQRLNLKTRDGEFIKSYSLKNGNYFEVHFRHSVNKGLIIERYQLDKKSGLIYLKNGWFENYGAGMMDTIDEDMKIFDDGNMMRIDFPENKIESVNFASAGIADHTFIYGKNRISLYEEYPYKTINFGIEDTSYIEIIKLFIMNKIDKS